MIEIVCALKKHNKRYFYCDYKSAYKHLLPDISFGCLSGRISLSSK